MQQKGADGVEEGVVLSCGFVIFLCVLCLSFWPVTMGEKKKKKGHGENDTLSVATATFWICKALQSSAGSPQEM